jgi:hypothetical protein
VCSQVQAYQRAWGWCQLGGQQVSTSSILSSNYFQQTFPGCTVTVYLTGTLTLATLYSNNSSTPLANPFTAQGLAGANPGYWYFYANSTAPNNRYDVVLSGGGLPATLTYSDIELTDLSAGAITAVNSQTGPAITIQSGTSGASFNISNPSSNVIQINCPQATSSVSGCLASADWTTFNNKQGGLTFSTPLVNTSGTVTITLPLTLAQGGTGATTQQGAVNAIIPFTTIGDMLGFNGTNVVRIAIGGSNGMIPMVNSSSGVGWSWTACPFCVFNSPLGTANGGTGLTGGTSGGIDCWTSSSVLAASNLLGAGNPVIGGGAGVCPGTSGVFAAYNGQTLAGQGMPPILAAPTLATAQSATVGPTTLVSSAPAGTYELCYYAVITQAATSSSSLTPTFSWNDGSSRSTTNLNTTLVPNFQADTSNNAGDILNGCVTVPSVASQNITYTFTYASSGATSMEYSYTVTAKRIR